MIDSGRGAATAEDAQGTPAQSHISPSVLIYEENIVCRPKQRYLLQFPRKWMCQLLSRENRDFRLSFPRNLISVKLVSDDLRQILSKKLPNYKLLQTTFVPGVLFKGQIV